MKYIWSTLSLALLLVACQPPNESKNPGTTDNNGGDDLPEAPEGKVGLYGTLTGAFEDYIPIASSDLSTWTSGTVLPSGKFVVFVDANAGPTYLLAYWDVDGDEAFDVEIDSFIAYGGNQPAPISVGATDVKDFSLACLAMTVATVNVAIPADTLSGEGRLTVSAISKDRTNFFGEMKAQVPLGTENNGTTETVRLVLPTGEQYSILASVDQEGVSSIGFGHGDFDTTLGSGDVDVALVNIAEEDLPTLSGTISGLPTGYDKNDLKVALMVLDTKGALSTGSGWTLSNATAHTIDYLQTLDPGFYYSGATLAPSETDFEGVFSGWSGGDTLLKPTGLIELFEGNIDADIALQEITTAGLTLTLVPPAGQNAPASPSPLEYVVWPVLPGLDSRSSTVTSDASHPQITLQVPAGFPIEQVSLYWDGDGDGHPNGEGDWVSRPRFDDKVIAEGMTSSGGEAEMSAAD